MVAEIHDLKTRLYKQMVRAGKCLLRPGVKAFIANVDELLSIAFR